MQPLTCHAVGVSGVHGASTIIRTTGYRGLNSSRDRHVTATPFIRQPETRHESQRRPGNS